MNVIDKIEEKERYCSALFIDEPLSAKVGTLNSEVYFVNRESINPKIIFNN